jgi:hypothetical protein
MLTFIVYKTKKYLIKNLIFYSYLEIEAFLNNERMEINYMYKINYNYIFYMSIFSLWAYIL